MYWENIEKIKERQIEKGISKYGQILEENTGMSMIERIEYLEEELVDALMYVEHIKALVPGSDVSEFKEELIELHNRLFQFTVTDYKLEDDHTALERAAMDIMCSALQTVTCLIEKIENR